MPRLADRLDSIELSGVRRVFELARTLTDPVNLSIGQPHFPVPDAVKAAAKSAIDADRNGYTLTQGIPELRQRVLADAAAHEVEDAPVGPPTVTQPAEPGGDSPLDALTQSGGDLHR